MRKFKKGSKEAKEYMAHLRAMRGSKSKLKGGNDTTTPVTRWLIEREKRRKVRREERERQRIQWQMEMIRNGLEAMFINGRDTTLRRLVRGKEDVFSVDNQGHVRIDEDKFKQLPEYARQELINTTEGDLDNLHNSLKEGEEPESSSDDELTPAQRRAKYERLWPDKYKETAEEEVAFWEEYDRGLRQAARAMRRGRSDDRMEDSSSDDSDMDRPRLPPTRRRRRRREASPPADTTSGSETESPGPLPDSMISYLASLVPGSRSYDVPYDSLDEDRPPTPPFGSGYNTSSILKKHGIHYLPYLRGKGYNSSPLKGMGCKSSVKGRRLKSSLKGKGYNSAPLKGMGYNSAPLKGMGYNSSPLEGMGYNSSPLEGMGYNSSPLEGMGYNSSPLEGMGYNSSPIEGMGYNSSPLEGMGFDNSILEGMGIIVDTLRSLGIPPSKYGLTKKDTALFPMPVKKVNLVNYTTPDERAARITLFDESLMKPIKDMRQQAIESSKQSSSSEKLKTLAKLIKDKKME